MNILASWNNKMKTLRFNENLLHLSLLILNSSVLCWVRVTAVSPENSTKVAVGDGQPHHGKHMGHQEEYDLVDVVQQRFWRITIRPYHQASCSWMAIILLIVDGDGVEESGDGHQEAHKPDENEGWGCRFHRKMRWPWPHYSHVSETIDSEKLFFMKRAVVMVVYLA